jgi:hypothetical protein
LKTFIGSLHLLRALGQPRELQLRCSRDVSYLDAASESKAYGLRLHQLRTRAALK